MLVKSSYLQTTMWCRGDRRNQRNHRVPPNIRHRRKHCPRRMDHPRCGGSFACQLGRRRRFPAGPTHRHLRHPQIPRLPAPLLQLQKMHLRHGQARSTILWETQPQRLQIQLPSTRRPLLLHSARTLAGSNLARLNHTSLHPNKNRSAGDSLGIHGFQRLNMANNSKKIDFESKAFLPQQRFPSSNKTHREGFLPDHSAFCQLPNENAGAVKEARIFEKSYIRAKE